MNTRNIHGDNRPAGIGGGVEPIRAERYVALRPFVSL
jgi:hypothetical protein